MRDIHQWLRDYAQSHTHPTNERLHWVCVPLIVLSLVGLLWAIPAPSWLRGLFPLANWATLFLLASLAYYLMLSFALTLGMVPVLAIIVAAVWWLDGLAAPLWLVSAIIFVVAWIGQFIGHAVEGKRPSFFEDVQFLMIGPLWLLAAVYRRLGIPY
ncbi:MAG: Mpo1-like protein [Gammaproteobacteria bacterium]|nr:Mpo1-like protein [Gammaproteobacteria bacterium]